MSVELWVGKMAGLLVAATAEKMAVLSAAYLDVQQVGSSVVLLVAMLADPSVVLKAAYSDALLAGVMVGKMAAV